MKIRKRKIPAVILAIWLMLGMGQMVNAQTIGAVEAESNSVEVQEPEMLRHPRIKRNRRQAH